MNRYKIIGSLLLMLLAVTSVVSGQTDSIRGKHSLKLSVLPSFNRLSYESADNSSEGSLRLGLDLGYTYHLTNRWGLGVGLRYQPFTSNYKNQGYEATSGFFTEPNGYNYVINQTLNNTEKQCVNYFMIPVLASYGFPVSGKLSARVAAGVAYGLAFGEKLQFRSGSVVRSAYFPDHDLVIDDLREHSLGTFTDYMSKEPGKQLNNAFMGIAELGAEYALNQNWLLTASVNGILGGDVKKNYESIIQPYSYSGVTASNYIGAVKPVSVGVSIGVIYRFGGKASRSVEPAPVVSVVSPVAPDEKTSPELVTATSAEPADKVAKEVVEEAIDTEKLILDEFRTEVMRFNADENIQFNFNQRELNEALRTRLAGLVELMAKSECVTLIVGHTCNIGSEEVNYLVGLERAKRVKQYLVEQGIPKSKIQIGSKGAAEPKFPNDTRANRAKNRRVEIIIK